LLRRLSQFPLDLQEAALGLLSHIRVIDERELALAINDTLQESQFKAGDKVALVPLGGIWDSAQHLMYNLREIRQGMASIPVPSFATLDDNLALRADQIIFFDDNVNSGLQVLNIFAGWMAQPLPPEVDLKEEHVQPLSPEACERLRKTPISLIFGVGTEGADRRVRTLLSDHLGFSPTNVAVMIRNLLKDSEKVLSGRDSPFDAENKNRLMKYLTDIGTQLMLSEGKSPNIAAQRALGDGSAEALVVFPYNVPTMTITALWCGGKIDKGEWTPLVERRRRRKLDGSLAGEDA
jgi:hypothetical protein